MLVYDRRVKPFVVKGPCMLQQDLQRTECSLFLNIDEDNKMAAFDVRQNAYKQSYNFCDLPEIPNTNLED